MALAAEVVAIPHDPEVPDRSEVGYRMAWARTYLKKGGLLVNPKQGTWALTEQGRSAGQVDARVFARRWCGSCERLALPRATLTTSMDS